MSLGAVKAKVRVIAAIDNDPACKATYEENHKGVEFLDDDIKEITPPDLADLGVVCDDDNMIFIGCSPCQYWSGINGKPGSERKAAAKPARNLLREFLRFVKHFRPGWVVVENVTGILRHEDDSGLSELRAFLEENGYKSKEDRISVRDYGVPQTRTRFVLVARRTDCEKKVPFPRKAKIKPTVKSTIGHLPAIEAGEEHPRDELHRSAGLNDINIKRLAVTDEGGDRGGWKRKHSLQINAYRGKDISFFRENYGRMWWDKPAPTITTRFSSLSCGRFGHPSQNRAISLREGAMLQTFPKSYKFKTKSITDTARLIGNAVPPEFAKRLFSAIARAK